MSSSKLEGLIGDKLQEKVLGQQFDQIRRDTSTAKIIQEKERRKSLRFGGKN